MEAFKLIIGANQELNEHHIKVAKIALVIAQAMQLNSVTCNKIHNAALEHDVGKIFLDQRILNKPSKLSFKEYEHLKSHVMLSVSHLLSKKWDSEIIQYVFHHHENYDGSGYPLKLKGNEIPIGAKILRIADVYAALTVNRVYRKELSTEQALSIMDTEKKFYDLDIYNLFKQIIKNNKGVFT